MSVGILQQKVTQGIMIFCGLLLLSFGSFVVMVVIDLQQEINENNSFLREKYLTQFD